MADETTPAPFDPGARNASTFASLDAFVEALERARVQALLAPDLPLLWRLHAPDYQLVTPSGRPFDRERYLHDIETGTLRYLRWDIAELRVRASPAMALVRYRATLELDGGGGSGTPFPCWHTDSYELRDGRWRRSGRRRLRSARPDRHSATLRAHRPAVAQGPTGRPSECSTPWPAR